VHGEPSLQRPSKAWIFEVLGTSGASYSKSADNIVKAEMQTSGPVGTKQRAIRAMY
jgi:hypothetical protein